MPSEIGTLTHLREIDVSGNSDMGGMIPTELGQLTSLTHVDLRGSNFTGDLPLEWCLQSETEQGKFMVEVLANCSLVNCCE